MLLAISTTQVKRRVKKRFLKKKKKDKFSKNLLQGDSNLGPHWTTSVSTDVVKRSMFLLYGD